MTGALNEILAAIDVEAYCENLGVTYRRTTGRSGPQINVRECPRCGGSDWKVFLNADTGLGSCFHGSCSGEPGFNLVSFTKAFFNVPGGDAIKKLSEFAKQSGWISTAKARAMERKLRRPAAQPIELQLPESIPITRGAEHPYLLARGLSGDDCARYELRFCEQGWFKYGDEDEQEPKYQDYSSRIIIPVRDVDGKAVTFQGRAIDTDAHRKYLFPPGLPGTSRFLYNANRCAGKPVLLMGEGVFDVIAIEKAFNFESDIGAIGSFGMAISGDVAAAGTEDQITKLLWLKERGLQRIVMMWDGANSAVESACKAAMAIRKTGIHVYVAQLPLDKDPNEVAPEVVRAAYVNAISATAMGLVKLRMSRKR